jgi:4-hydroxy-3-polyprenylbenzoate decarboxylase
MKSTTLLTPLKYLVVVDDDVDMHNTDPQRDSIFTKGPSDVLDHATSEIASGSKPGIDATKKLPGEGFKRPWPPCGDEALGERRPTLIKMDKQVQEKITALFGGKT